MAIPSKKTVRKIVLVLLALLAAATLIYLFVVRPIQVRQEKKRFEQAAAELEKLYTQIEAVAGKPDQVKREKSCGRANLKGARGPLSCNVSVYFLYEKRGFEGANNIMTKASTLKQIPLKAGAQTESSLFVPELSSYSNQSFKQSFSFNQVFECILSYNYPARGRYGEPFKPSSAEDLQIGLLCSKPALTEHYPIRN